MNNSLAKRHEFIKRRKNFLPTLIVTILLWTFLVLWVLLIDPDTFLAIPLFILLTFLSFLFTFSTLLGDSRRGLLISIGICLFLILRLLGIGNILNAILILGVLITTEFYFIRKKR